MLKPQNVSPRQLFLDPNNPRLFKDFSGTSEIADEDVADCQSELEGMFSSSKSEFTNISDLENSMRQIGFVEIQNIIVRELAEKKFLVVEGNRRVATIKKLLKEHDEASPGTKTKRIEDPEKLASLMTIQVMVLDTHGLTHEEIHEKIKFTLGLRHIGGQLEWRALPKGHNIFLEYMKLLPDGSQFTWNSHNGAQIADILAVGRPQVRNSLRGFIAYTEMGAISSEVKPKHYSLIYACVTNRSFADFEFITMNSVTFSLEGDSANNILQICEFEDRDSRDGSENILREPKAVNQLGLLLKDAKSNPRQGVRNMAMGLFSAVVEREMSLESARTKLKAFKRNDQWVQALEKLLEKQVSDPNLSSENFINQGKELKLKSDLMRLLAKFELLLEL